MAGPTVLVSYHVPSDLPGIIPSDPCLGQALASLGPSPRRQRSGLTFWSGRGRRTTVVTTPTALPGVLPPAAFFRLPYRGSTVERVKCVLKTKRIPLTEEPDRCSSIRQVSQTSRGHLLTRRFAGWDISLPFSILSNPWTDDPDRCSSTGSV